jgi:hypothetical protein
MEINDIKSMKPEEVRAYSLKLAKQIATRVIVGVVAGVVVTVGVNYLVSKIEGKLYAEDTFTNE